MRRNLFLAALALGSLTTLAEAQTTQTLPRGFDTTEGTSSTGFPFSTTGTHKWHWVYDAGQFDATFPILITQIDVRPNGGVASWGPATYENFEMSLGASVNDYGTATYDPTFDNNFVTGSKQVFFSGNLNVPAGTGGASPNPWSIQVIGGPYLYDPTTGNDFIVELRTPGSGSGNPTLHSTDGASAGAGANGGNRYGSTTDPNATTWTFSNNEFVPIVQIHYTPANGIFAGFDGTPLTGSSPLAVQFTDSSFSSDPGGITSWAWDFGDGNTANVQNPLHTYTQCGTYTVSLTVTDVLNGSSTETKVDYVVVDPMVADFTASPTSGACGALTVTFTDTTTGNPTTWAWDFDDDGTVDSTVQNPTHTYTGQGSFSVRMTASNSCRSDTVVKSNFILLAGKISSLFAANNGGSVGGAVYFDVTITASALDFTGVELNYDATVGTPVGCSVYVTPGTSVGNETNPALWTLVAEDDGNATSNGADVPTPISFVKSFTLGAGSYGIAIVSEGDGHRYTNGTGANQMFSNADLSVSLGTASNVPFSGSVFNPRVANMSLLYCPCASTSAVSVAGQGCADVTGQNLAVNVSGCPDLGGVTGIELVGGAANTTPTFMIGGVSDTNLGAIPLPFDLTPFGAPGCTAYTSQELILGPIPTIGGSALLALPVPNDPNLIGGTLHWQGWQVEFGINPLNIVSSNYASTTIGN